MFCEPQPVTSHEHDSRQKTVSHEDCPVQATLHAPGPHKTQGHDRRPLHWSVHDILRSQSKPGPHESGVLQRTSQWKPTGHTISTSQLAPAAQSTTQVCSSAHDVHCEGHTNASTDSKLGRSNRHEQASTSATRYQRMARAWHRVRSETGGVGAAKCGGTTGRSPVDRHPAVLAAPRGGSAVPCLVQHPVGADQTHEQRVGHVDTVDR